VQASGRLFKECCKYCLYIDTFFLYVCHRKELWIDAKVMGVEKGVLLPTAIVQHEVPLLFALVMEAANDVSKVVGEQLKVLLYIVLLMVVEGAVKKKVVRNWIKVGGFVNLMAGANGVYRQDAIKPLKEVMVIVCLMVEGAGVHSRVAPDMMLEEDYVVLMGQERNAKLRDVISSILEAAFVNLMEGGNGV